MTIAAPSFKSAIRIGLVGLAATVLSACHDDDPWNKFQPFDVPNSVAIADMNADGRNDVVSAFTHVNGPNPNRGYASVILQNEAPAAAGTFARGLDSGVGYNPITLAVDNINATGSPDVAIANANSGTVSLLLQSGDTGQLSTLVTLSVGGRPFDVALGRVDADALIDVVVANVSRSTVSLFHQEVGGTFTAPVALAVDNISTAVAIGDIDGDGMNDIAVANQDLGGNSGRVSLFFATNNAAIPVTFAPRIDVAAGTEPIAVRIADLDANGLGDLIVANEGRGSALMGTSGVTVILQTAPRVFAAPVTYSTAYGAVGLAIGDVNEDGRLDIVTANRGGSPRGTVSVLLQHDTTDGVFLSAVNYSGIYEPLGVAIGDLNDDGIPDLAVADGNRAAIMLNSSTTPGQFGSMTRIGE